MARELLSHRLTRHGLTAPTPARSPPSRYGTLFKVEVPIVGEEADSAIMHLRRACIQFTGVVDISVLMDTLLL